jgi:hypothetical protein
MIGRMALDQADAPTKIIRGGIIHPARIFWSLRRKKSERRFIQTRDQLLKLSFGFGMLSLSRQRP